MKKLKVTVDGQEYEVEVEELDAPETSSQLSTASSVPVEAGEGEDVTSPLAGKVVEIKVAVGDHVSEGDTLLVLEAMKMNTLVNATLSGVVTSINVSPGDMVEEGQALATIG